MLKLFLHRNFMFIIDWITSESDIVGVTGQSGARNTNPKIGCRGGATLKDSLYIGENWLSSSWDKNTEGLVVWMVLAIKQTINPCRKQREPFWFSYCGGSYRCFKDFFRSKAAKTICFWLVLHAFGDFLSATNGLLQKFLSIPSVYPYSCPLSY